MKGDFSRRVTLKRYIHRFLPEVGAYEMSHGKIPIPLGAVPPEPQPPTAERAADPFSYRFYEYIKKRREEFMAE
jgi:hypothetical protein